MCQFIVSMRRMHLIQTSTTKCILSQIKNQNKTINRFVQYKFTQPAQIWKLSLLAEDLGSLTEKKNSLSGSVRCYVGAFFFVKLVYWRRFLLVVGISFVGLKQTWATTSEAAAAEQIIVFCWRSQCCCFVTVISWI